MSQVSWRADANATDRPSGDHVSPATDDSPLVTATGRDDPSAGTVNGRRAWRPGAGRLPAADRAGPRRPVRGQEERLPRAVGRPADVAEPVHEPADAPRRPVAVPLGAVLPLVGLPRRERDPSAVRRPR